MMTFHSLVLRMKCVNECKSHKPGLSTGPTDRWCRPLSLLSPSEQFRAMGMGVRERLGVDSCLSGGCFASCLTPSALLRGAYSPLRGHSNSRHRSRQ